VSDFDAEVDERKQLIFLHRLGKPQGLTERPLSKWRSRSDIYAAVALFGLTLPIAIGLRAIGL
jgi:hypothetical protein